MLLLLRVTVWVSGNEDESFTGWGVRAPYILNWEFDPITGTFEKI